MDEGKGIRNVVEERERKGCAMSRICARSERGLVSARKETRGTRQDAGGSRYPEIQSAHLRCEAEVLLCCSCRRCRVLLRLGGGLIAGGNANSVRLESDAAPAPFAVMLSDSCRMCDLPIASCQ